MEKENQIERQKDMGKIKVVFLTIVLTILFLIELYIMINDSQNYISLAVVAVIMLAIIYLLVIAVMQEKYKRETLKQERYENIYKSEKASYLLMRKYFTELDERMCNLEKDTVKAKSEIITAQKAIAKVSISRNKENSDALMNSNDKLLEKVFDLEGIAEKENSDLLNRQKEIIENANKDILMKQQEMIAQLKQMELSICKEMMSNPGAAMNMDRTEVAQEKEAEIDLAEDEPMMDDLLGESKSREDSKELNGVEDLEEITESLVEDTSEELEETLVEDAAEELGLTDDEPLSDDLMTEDFGQEKPDLDPNKPMSPEDIAALLASTNAAEPTVDSSVEEPAEEVVEPELTAEPEVVPEMEVIPEVEPVVEAVISEPEIMEEAVMEPIPEEGERKAPEIDMSDPNKPMSPEDIAALLASVNTSETAEETPVPEPEPEVKEEAPKREDPNRKMSPEEIAALFANN